MMAAVETKHRRIAWGIACASAAVLAAATVALLPEILCAWHLHRLREDPGRLESMLGSSPAEREAVRRFARERAGREAVLRAYLGGVDLKKEDLARLARLGEGVILATRTAHYLILAGGRRWRVELPRPPRDIWANGPDLLYACCRETIRLPDFAAMEFQLEAVNEERLAPSVWASDGRPIEVDQVNQVLSRGGTISRDLLNFVCFFRPPPAQ